MQASASTHFRFCYSPYDRRRPSPPAPLGGVWIRPCVFILTEPFLQGSFPLALFKTVTDCFGSRHNRSFLAFGDGRFFPNYVVLVASLRPTKGKVFTLAFSFSKIKIPPFSLLRTCEVLSFFLMSKWLFQLKQSLLFLSISDPAACARQF